MRCQAWRYVNSKIAHYPIVYRVYREKKIVISIPMEIMYEE
jgi:hypothetical protein